MNNRYDKNDFQLIVEKKKTIEEIAKKYNVSTQCIHRQMNRAGFYISKRKIVILSPYQLKECNSVQETADQLGVSHTTIRNALNGKQPKILEELKIKVWEIKNDN